EPSPAQPAVERPGKRAPRRWREGAGWLLAAAIALAAALGLLRGRGERDALRASVAEAGRARDAAARELDAVRTQVAERDRLLAQLTGPGVRVLELKAGGTAPVPAPRLASARMFWDRSTGSWTMFVHDLAPPPAGRTYQLWLVTPRAKIPAGTFTPSPAGDAIVHATYALDPAALRAVAVTEEPEGGVPQPTGRVVIVGAAE
ncbi:MAG: anti-sigma factor domain-containing protein, partial [Gemmatimonadaceae bacterium]